MLTIRDSTALLNSEHTLLPLKLLPLVTALVLIALSQAAHQDTCLSLPLLPPFGLGQGSTYADVAMMLAPAAMTATAPSTWPVQAR